MARKTNRRKFIRAAGLAATGMVAAASPLAAGTTEPQARPAPRTMGARLRELLRKGETFENVAAYDVLSARMAELIGFPSLYIGGSAMAEFHGEPGWALTTMTERIEYAGHIAKNVDIPAIADIDDGGDALTLYRTVKDFERAGLGAVHFGDGIAAMGRTTGLLTKNQMVDKIHAAADARSDTIVSVRLQGLNIEMMEKTLERGAAYAEAGADVLWFVPMPIADHPKAAAAVKVPLTAQLFFDQPLLLAKNNKVTIAVYASFLQNIAQSAVYDALMELKTTGLLLKSAKGQRLGNTIPADFRAKMVRQAEHTERGTKYNVGR